MRNFSALFLLLLHLPLLSADSVTVEADGVVSKLGMSPQLQRYHALRTALETQERASASQAVLLAQAADAASLVKRYDEALTYRRRLLSLQLAQPASLTVATLIESYASIAQELQHVGLYEDALTILTKAQNASRVPLDPGTLSILAHFRASVLDCLGRPAAALQTWLQGMQLRRQARERKEGAGQAASSSASSPSSSSALAPLLGSAHSSLDSLLESPSERLTLLDLLRKVLHDAHARDAGEPISRPGEGEEQEVQALAALPQPAVLAEERHQVTSLLAAGPWAHPLQLPKTFLPGLTSRPWHSMEAGREGAYPHLAPVAQLLREATRALRAEYKSLSKRHKLYRETECIHTAPPPPHPSTTPRGAAAVGKWEQAGGWYWYATNGYWTEQDADGCARDTPAACALLARIAALAIPGLVVHRAGYSAVGGKAHLRPHCGHTNAQLKMHLGLIVPVREAEAGGGPPPPCATLRVGDRSERGNTRAWGQGEVLFFDDSWEHEVVNTCPALRVVFQLVIAHPDLHATDSTALLTGQARPGGALPAPPMQGQAIGH